VRALSQRKTIGEIVVVVAVLIAKILPRISARVLLIL
jgi:hypothetical protein